MAGLGQQVKVTIDDLPPEMMEKIFEHLTFHERLLTSATCKMWHKLIFCPQFCKRLFLHLRTTEDLVEKLYATDTIRRARNIIISCSDLGNNELAMLKTCMKGASLELFRISTNKHAGKHILETILKVLTKLESLHLELVGNHDNEVIQIRHSNLRRVVLNGQWNYAIDCENLTTLESDQVNEKSIQGLSGLQRQLRSLKLFGLNGGLFSATTFSVICGFQWDHLRELCFNYSPPLDQLKKMLEHMPCLENLSLHRSRQTLTGKELAPARSLSQLALGEQCIETVMFNKFLTCLSLHKLSLLKCMFTASEVPLKSDFVERLFIQPVFGKLLPVFPNLKILVLEGTYETDFPSILKQICETYTKLEYLTIGVKGGEIGQFDKHTETEEVTITNPLLLLGKLEKLKFVQINRMDLNKINWIACTGSKVEFIRLFGCSINGDGTEKLIRTFDHLRKLYLDHCYLRHPGADLFDVDETCCNGLRTRVPHCKISYYDCHIEDLYDYCGRSGHVI